MNKHERAVVKATMQWYHARLVSLELAAMDAPAYLWVDRRPEVSHSLFKACHIIAAAKRKGQK